jgi:hypothetical protein
MATVTFSPFIQQHISCQTGEAFGNTVREVMEAYFEKHANIRGCILDERGVIRPRLSLFVDGVIATDRVSLSEPVHACAQIFICEVPLDTEYEDLH